jgi:hypothetical protein
MGRCGRRDRCHRALAVRGDERVGLGLRAGERRDIGSPSCVRVVRYENRPDAETRRTAYEVIRLAAGVNTACESTRSVETTPDANTTAARIGRADARAGRSLAANRADRRMTANAKARKCQCCASVCTDRSE